MIEVTKVEYQTCNLSQAMIRNINDHFISVSFDFLKGGDINVRIILRQLTKNEENYIEDIMAEFSSSQKSNCVRSPEVLVGEDMLPLKNLVYKQRVK
jgi:hypothetical protein